MATEEKVKKEKKVKGGSGKGLKPAKNLDAKTERDPNYLWSMSMAPKIDDSTHWFQMLPAAFFTAFIIIITRMYNYERPMEQFYWAGKATSLSDFFSYFKMVAICICTVLALVLLLYRVFTQSLYIKKTFVYIPIVIYAAFTILSYAFSDYKEFAWLGYNDRFEGTVVLLAYMVMLFYIINSVNSERNIKWIIYPVAISSVILGALGISQAINKDFLRTTIGQKVIVPNKMTENGMLWDLIDKATEQGKQWLEFTFKNKEIYQTVYNTNYVSFYLTLLVPLFAMLFIYAVMRGKEENILKKIIWGALFTLAVFNMIGSVSSGGYLGLIAIFVVGVVVLNKRIITWWKPIVILLVLFILMAGVNYKQLQQEFMSFKGFFGNEITTTQEIAPEGESAEAAPTKTYIDYVDTVDDKIKISVNGNEMALTVTYDDPSSIIIKDKNDKNIPLELIPGEDGYLHKFNDERFSTIKMRPATDDENNSYYIIYIDDSEWIFKLTPEGPTFVNQMGFALDLDPIPHIGFKNNPTFGSGRGYIWSTTIPMIKDTLFLGHGADTYCLYYPHKDYAGKYNSGTFTGNPNIVVDKPHNMYMGVAINTGVISLIALLVLFGMYIVQSIIIYIKRDFQGSFTSFVGAGLFLGLTGFLAAALVNDSSVSVMPMFYGLLGTGISINMIIQRSMPIKIKVKKEKKEKKVKEPKPSKDKAPKEIAE